MNVFVYINQINILLINLLISEFSVIETPTPTLIFKLFNLY